MTELNTHQQTLKALAQGEPGAGTRSGELLKEDPVSYGLLCSATFVGLVEKYFRGDRSLEAVKNFVSTTIAPFQATKNPPKPIATEALIRAVWEDDLSIEEIDINDQRVSELLVIKRIVHESEEIRNDLDLYLKDAQLIVTSWLEQEGQERELRLLKFQELCLNKQSTSCSPLLEIMSVIAPRLGPSRRSTISPVLAGR